MYKRQTVGAQQVVDADGHAVLVHTDHTDAAGDGEGEQRWACLLYTSDAADERSSVDLGGRRIIKKKKKRQIKQSVSVWRETRRHTEQLYDI